MRILFLKQGFQPLPAFKGLTFAKALQERGHEVEVITGFPNYPGGKYYQGYHVRPYKKEVMDGITVHRMIHFPSHDKSAFHRIITYLSFSLSCCLLGPWLVKKPDLVYVYNLVTLGPPAFLLRFLFGAKVIIDIQDLWPESVAMSKMIRSKAVLCLLNAICGWIYRKADFLTVLSPGFRRTLEARGVSPKKIKVIYNWCEEASISANMESVNSVELPKSDGKFVILFAGSIGLAQGLDVLLDCASLSREMGLDVQFLLIGGGVDRQRLQKRTEEMALRNVTFLQPRPMEKMGEIYKMADALLVHLKDDPLFRITIPSKTQAYLYVGKPIIVAMRGDAAELVQKAGAGLLCSPDDPEEMMNAIRTMYEMPESERRKMGERGHCYYLNCLSFDQGVQSFELVMSRLSKGLLD